MLINGNRLAVCSTRSVHMHLFVYMCNKTKVSKSILEKGTDRQAVVVSAGAFVCVCHNHCCICQHIEFFIILLRAGTRKPLVLLYFGLIINI
jgi:hypothetical protein